MIIVTPNRHAFNTDYMAELQVENDKVQGVIFTGTERGFGDWLLWRCECPEKVFDEIVDAMARGDKVYRIAED